MKKLVFLGGTVGNNPWRRAVIDALLARGVPRDVLFDPTVGEWTPEAQELEERLKATASHRIFYLGSPMQEGNPLSAFSMVEAAMSLYDFPSSTVVIIDYDGLEEHPLRVLERVEHLLRRRFPAVKILRSLPKAIDWLAGELLRDGVQG